MFLDLLAPAEKDALIDLALLAMRADRSISDEEVELLEEIRLELGVPEPAFVARVKGRPDKARALAAFSSRESRRMAFMELVLIAFVDGTYDPAESAYIKEVQAALQIPDGTRDKTFAWALQMIKLREQARAIVAE